MDLAKYIRHVIKTQTPGEYRYSGHKDGRGYRTLLTYKNIMVDECTDGSFVVCSLFFFDENTFIKALIDARGNINNYSIIDETPEYRTYNYRAFRVVPQYIETVQTVKYW